MPEPQPVVITAFDVPPSPFATGEPRRAPFRIGLVQERWRSDPAEHAAALAAGARRAADLGARLICFQELTLSPYFAIAPDDPAAAGRAESIPDGPTTRLASRFAAETGAFIQMSLYERAEDGVLGFNTAICVSPAGEVISRTRKIHIPEFPTYHEDCYFRRDTPRFPLALVGEAKCGFPTCWDQWFPEIARAYSLAGADLIVYPTAIGSDPLNPDFDSQAAWQQVIVANGIMNATFMAAVNRTGEEGPTRFYGSSFVSDPYGRVLARAPRDEAAVIVADLDLDQHADWLRWGVLATRRPEAYTMLTDPALVPPLPR